MGKTKTVYFGAGWFNEKQNKAYQEAMSALAQNPTIDLENSYVPLDHQYKGINVAEHPEYLHDREWANATYRGDLTGIKANDVMIGVYLPDEEDVGLGMELGYAMSQGKYIVLVIPDEDFGKSINLMSWGVCDNAIKISELKNFDFNKPTFNFYDGGVY
ncbi:MULTISPECIES: nucleoside 2-deoxyribosyltransferase [unclassified Lactobacillus]|uniref:nucleoside 2-deoxyribosyltransferase n=1 Tax=unclassified Lactobacillus TaxID=2620435 RepID=UPI000EFAE770|nr:MULTISPECIES: nucleoside 2-deoxyribosyltransferase [unclassified Lactobacillus]RMC38662.1 nucleoside 2-deoxyribosyltransferase [Lactobacillus sp. ESL0237]RMC43007.1 nucleoside 2-deoxyribosyltransferase [Lactobacillus sp. ESL0234]RMC43861.1 nucleoside 2-deoxyribosyltransferase [Lactobacillus sp. ESL0236]RMC44862.1 nucleoside 2-deoxyribosyltransferase [Lactobacillus sp. ESL0230]RMC48109.1 nucleoside 2-deoxyribosyltransferase [Lactobacillus sp. ESL0225]